jgi:adhesin transport system membrane fusion protein
MTSSHNHRRGSAHRFSFWKNTPITLWATTLVLIVGLVWASQSEIEQITRASGQVIASSRTQIIQSLDGGVLETLMVKEGDEVTKGQLLAKLDTTKLTAAYRDAESKVAALKASSARLKAEIFGDKVNFGPEVNAYPQFRETQTLLLAKRRAAIEQDIAALIAMKALATKELRMTEPLLKTGDVSQVDVLRLERQVADLQAQITNKQNKYLQDTQAEASKVAEDLASAEQVLLQRKDQLVHAEIRAPSNGIVKNVRVTTLGGVLKPSEELMQIVPIEDALLIEVKARPADIAFIKPGLPANVKIDAYDYTIYGTLTGKVTYISVDTLSEDLRQGEQPYYRVQIKTDGKLFKGRPNEKLEIQPGMTAVGEVITGSNTVLRYLIKPLVKTMNESLVER